MGMFPRRTVQRALDQLAIEMPASDAAHLLHRLREPDDRIGAEWEAVGTATLAQLATVRSQMLLGSRRPDLHVSSGDLEFVADFRAVSDSHVEKENPVEYFAEELHRVAVKHGMDGAGLYFDVETITNNPGKRMLALPTKGEVPKFIKEHVRPFVARVARTRTREEQVVAVGDVRLRLRYDPRTQFSGRSHAVYTNPRSATDNSMFRALVKKATQMRESATSELKGIFICDGGSDTVDRSPDRVVKAFFEQHQETISFIVVVRVARVLERFPNSSRLRAYSTVYWNPRHSTAARLHISTLIERWTDSMPSLAREPSTEFRYPVPFPMRGSFFGNYSMNGYEMRLSSWGILRLIAGEIAHAMFDKHHTQLVGAARYRHEHGEYLTGITLDRRYDVDDDWIVLSFSKDAPRTRFLDDLQQLLAGILSAEEFAHRWATLVETIRLQLARGARLIEIQVDADRGPSFDFDGLDAAITHFQAGDQTAASE